MRSVNVGSGEEQRPCTRFLELTFIIKYTVISLFIKVITFRIFNTYNMKLCKILIKSNYFPKQRQKNCLINIAGICRRQVHIKCIMQYSTETKVCFSKALGQRPSCIWHIKDSGIESNCLMVLLQYSKKSTLMYNHYIRSSIFGSAQDNTSTISHVICNQPINLCCTFPHFTKFTAISLKIFLYIPRIE